MSASRAPGKTPTFTARRSRGLRSFSLRPGVLAGVTVTPGTIASPEITRCSSSEPPRDARTAPSPLSAVSPLWAPAPRLPFYLVPNKFQFGDDVIWTQARIASKRRQRDPPARKHMGSLRRGRQLDLPQPDGFHAGRRFAGSRTGVRCAESHRRCHQGLSLLGFRHVCRRPVESHQQADGERRACAIRRPP